MTDRRIVLDGLRIATFNAWSHHVELLFQWPEADVILDHYGDGWALNGLLFRNGNATQPTQRGSGHRLTNARLLDRLVWWARAGQPGSTLTLSDHDDLFRQGLLIG